MKLISLAAIVVAASAGSAFAADLPSIKGAPAAPVVVSPWDYDFGGQLTTDYLFRGITQSNHQPSVWAHGELRYNASDVWQLYAGVSSESIKFTNNSYPVGSPAVEIDGDAGVRGTWGAFSTDVGGIYYGYPDSPIGLKGFAGGAPAGLSPRNPGFFEIYAKPTYTVNETLTIGGNFFYTPSYLNTGANGEYLSGTAKITGPGSLSAFSLSGEVGYQWLGQVDSIYVPAYLPRRQLPSYTYYNVGVSYGWKFVTLDVRYFGTSLSRSAAYGLTGIPDSCSAIACSTTSKYGDNAVVGTISFDLTSKDLK
jgi:uncharacterized protein (TIGR02001 family)